jgi:hypothetical protein
MPVLALLQAGESPGWIGPAVAISLLVMSLASLLTAVFCLVIARRASQQAQALSESLQHLRTELAPAFKTVAELSQDGRETVHAVKTEAVAIAELSSRLRGQVETAADRMRERLENLEALYDVLEGEIEETALDLAAGLRSLRRGAGWFMRLRRLLRRGRR